MIAFEARPAHMGSNGELLHFVELSFHSR